MALETSQANPGEIFRPGAHVGPFEREGRGGEVGCRTTQSGGIQPNPAESIGVLAPPLDPPLTVSRRCGSLLRCQVGISGQSGWVEHQSRSLDAQRGRRISRNVEVSEFLAWMATIPSFDVRSHPALVCIAIHLRHTWLFLGVLKIAGWPTVSRNLGDCISQVTC